MLNSRFQVGQERAAASRLAIKIFRIKHNVDPAKVAFGEYVEIDFERLVVFMVKIHGLSERARDTVEIGLVMTGDRAELCGQGKAAKPSA